MCAVQPCSSTLNTIETLKCAQPTAKVNLKPFSVLFLSFSFHFICMWCVVVSFFWRLFQVLVLMLLLLKTHPPSFAICHSKYSFARHIQLTHMPAYILYVCLLMSCVYLNNCDAKIPLQMYDADFIIYFCWVFFSSFYSLVYSTGKT